MWFPINYQYDIEYRHSVEKIDPEEIEKTSAWVEKLDCIKKTGEFEVVVFIFPRYREDIFLELKKKLIDFQIPCITWPLQSHFPQDDRDRWEGKFAKRQFSNLLLKMGAQRQTRNWNLTSVDGKRVLILAIYQTKDCFGFAWNGGYEGKVPDNSSGFQEKFGNNGELFYIVWL